MNHIQLFFLVTGQELVGKVVEQTDSTIKISNPRAVSIAQTGADTYQVRLIYFSGANPEGTFVFERSAILAISDSCPQDIETDYVRQTTGIQLIRG